MIKREVKEYKLSFDGSADYPVTAPFTLYSAMCLMGRVKKGDLNISLPLPEEARISAALDADESFFNGRFSYLRLTGAQTPCEVYLNGSLLGTLDGKRRVYFLDTDNRLVRGKNSIEIVFTSPEWNTGLLHNIEFLKFNNAIIDKVRVLQKHDEEGVTLDIQVDMIGDGESTRAVATLISGSGQIYYGGFNRGHATISVRDPLYWWPKGLGIQNVYKLSVNLYGEVEVEDTAEFKIGLRTLTVDRDTSGALLCANGVNYVPMGAVYIPERNYLPDESRKYTAAFVTAAAMANFNSFVIRASERLPSDEFFDLCDVHGINVIIEASEYSESLIDSLTRLAHHPSFAAVDLVGMEGSEVCKFSDRIEETGYGIELTVFADAPEYFGEASVPCDRTLFAVIDKEDRNPFSCKMEEHSGGVCRAMAASVAENYMYAYNPSDFAYLTRLAQAENTGKRMLDARIAFGRGGRAVFSSVGRQRIISDSSLDSNVSRKALHYYASSFFSPVAVRAQVSGSTVSFSATNAGKNAVFGTLEYRVIDSSNLLIYKDSLDIDIAEHSSRTLFSCDLGEHITSHENDRYIEYILTEGSHVLFRGTALFVPQKCFVYEKPAIKTEITGRDKRFSITITADKFVGSLEISFDETDAVFTDNYINITSPIPVKLDFTVSSPLETVKSLEKQLRIRYLYNIGKE